jgi:hypothetical protein
MVKFVCVGFLIFISILFSNGLYANCHNFGFSKKEALISYYEIEIENVSESINPNQKLPFKIEEFEIAGDYDRRKGKWILIWNMSPKAEIVLPEGFKITSIQVTGFLGSKDGSISVPGDLVTYSFSPPLTKKWTPGYILNGQYDNFKKKGNYKPRFFQITIIYLDDKNVVRSLHSERIYIEIPTK